MSVSILASIGFWLSLPLAAIQGIRLKRTAPRFPEATGERRGHVGQGEVKSLLAMGDSIIVGVGLDNIVDAMPVQLAAALANNHQCRIDWRLEAKNGANIRHLRKTLSGVESGQAADVILISIGVNDVTGLISKQAWKEQIHALVQDLSQRWPTAQVVFAGLPPMGRFPLPPQPLRYCLGYRARQLDSLAAEILSTQPRMQHIPTDINPDNQQFCDDGFHPSAESCRIWAKELAQRTKADNLDA